MTRPGAQRLPVNIFETPTEMVVVAAMPGIEPEDITLRLEGPILHIASEERGEEAVYKYSHREWSYGPYERWIEIPTPVDAGNANVTYGNGVLTLVLPKSAEYIEATIKVPRIGHARGAHLGHSGSERPAGTIR